MWQEIAYSLQSGNPYLLFMVAMSFFATVLIFERLIMFQFVYDLDFNKFLKNLKKMIEANDLDRAMNLCKSLSKTSLPKIALAALEIMESQPASAKGKIEEGAMDLLPRIEARISILPALANLILLVGVLGTIDQLWWAFHSLDVLDTVKKQASLSSGIAGALNPTALGLLLGIVILLGHQLLKSMALRLVERIHYGITVLQNLLGGEPTLWVSPSFLPTNAPPSSSPSVQQPLTPPPPPSPSTQQPQSTTQPQQEENRENESTDNEPPMEDIKDEEEII